MKEGDRFKLSCGHEGKVIWVSLDEKTFGVRGVRKKCNNCGKGSSSNWNPTVHLYSIEEE